MKYRDRTTSQIYTDFDIQQKFSNVSFPQAWDQTTFDYINCDPVIIVPSPPSQCTTRIDYVGVQFVNNQWTDVWSEVPKYNDSNEQAICETECLEVQWNTVRTERDILLLQSDWTQLADCPLSTEQKALWVTYRQDLRDVPQTQTDPLNIIWPSTP